MITVLGGADTDRPCVLFDSVLARGSIAASSGTGANFAGPQTFDLWQPSALPADLTLTGAVAETVDMFAIGSHNLKTRAAGLSVSYSTTLAGAWVTLATVTPVDDDPLALIFAPVTAMRWRVTVTGAALPALGAAMIGRRLVIPSYVADGYIPFARARRVDVLSGETLGGQMLSARFRRGGGDLSIKFNPVPRAWVDQSVGAFATAYDRGGAFFVASSPALAPDDMGYCRRRGDELRPSYKAGARWADLALEVASYGG
jgi:hypothetical protein